MRSISNIFRCSFLAVLSLALVVTLANCSKKEVKEDEPLINPSGGLDGESANQGAVDTSAAGSGSETPPPAISDSGELATIYFDFDSYRINTTARGDMKANADWLKQNSNATIQIEGHCDERGTTQYNLALGERRANATREYLEKLGIDKSRLSVISYGKEKPEDPGHDESAWAKNRRSKFVILSR